LTDDAL
jgi:hypothetical protein